MAELLIEFLSEEIPARMQARAADDLRRLVTDALVERGLSFSDARAFATPRRLALVVDGVPASQPDRTDERKGPRLSAPPQAKQGFFRSIGLSPEDAIRATALAPGAVLELGGVRLEARGEGAAAPLFAVTERRGRSAVEVIAEFMPDIVRGFPWPKSMRWGSGSLRWVRPLQSILAVLTLAPGQFEIVPFEVDGIAAGDISRGHRFLAPEPFRVFGFEDYLEKLEAAFVELDPVARKRTILREARALAHAQNLELVEDEGLLEETAGLVEWPVVLIGGFDEAFLTVPPEVIRTTIRANQKCFVTKDPVGGELTARFILVSNIVASDGGAAIVAGNERVVAARLSDARFFWATDKRVPLEQRAKKLESVVFHSRLGTQGERVERLVALAEALAPIVGANVHDVAQAAALAKADLATETVGEFPELQGLVGRYLAPLQGKPLAVGRAIEDHYKPQGPSDRVPRDPVSIAVALADKLDMLAGFWSIDELPTGSKDPYALRRAALGIIRTVLENGVRLPLRRVVDEALELHRERFKRIGNVFVFARRDEEGEIGVRSALRDWLDYVEETADFVFVLDAAEPERIVSEKARDFSDDPDSIVAVVAPKRRAAAGLIDFFTDRLKVQLREQGARHDLVDAVFSAGGQDDLVAIVRRVEALARFLETEDGRNLLAGFRRAANILKAEEKRDGKGAFDGPPEASLYREPAESDLAVALAQAESEARAAMAAEDYIAAMNAIATLRPSVDRFFEEVTVNAEEQRLRANRLRLLSRLRHATRAVADFERVEG